MARQVLAGLLGALVLTSSVPVRAADLDPETASAFARYVDLTEDRISADLAAASRFLWIDALPSGSARTKDIEALRRGEVLIERLETRDHGRSIPIDKGLIHHWLGLVFVPGATVDAAVALLQDYDHHAEVFSPAIEASRTLGRSGNRYRVYLRFHMKRIISATVDTENVADFNRPTADRAYSAIRSTRVAEVENPGTSDEHELPPGHDSGFVWRLNTYWRFLERDGGTYVQCESVSLSRDVPFGLGWIVKPFITGVPKDALAFTLERTRETLSRTDAH
jgi:hypothetical protein